MNGTYEYILEMRNITKTFPGVKALDNVDLKVKKGTVHAVMGENGAGKSTLMKVLMGIYRQNSGSIYFKGKEIHFKGPNDALQSGLAMIHQELSTVLDLSVAENIFLGKEITIGKTQLKQEKEMLKQTKKLFEQLDIHINPGEKMKNLSMARQQICEIAKAISYNSDLIIMDEPTSAITESEVEHLFKIIRSLIKKGITIIYITHKMAEVFEIADEISVYRDGHYINTVEAKNTTKDKLIEMMVGRQINQMFPKLKADIGEEIFKIEGLTRKNEFQDINFTVKRGEILGVAGLMGAGRSEIMEAIFGIRKKSGGDIFINKKKVKIKNPRNAINNGIAFLTENRKESGCFLALSVRINICITALIKFSKSIFVNYKYTIDKASKMKEALSIKTPSIEQVMKNLSGGNQQKVLLGRWLLTEPDILIVDEPTRGIDVGAKAEIHKLLSKLAQQGKAIIMISSELPEILGMSDRIMVISEGKVTGILDIKDANQEKILLYATGEHKKEEAIS